jgi:heterodisulfide reductase subunit B
MEPYMEISYYPGCSVKTNALNFETTALEVLKRLDITALELESWYCCGVMFSMASDNLMHQLAPIRTLIKAKESGRDRLLTLCSMCYNTLKRAENFIKGDEEKRNKIAEFMDSEDTAYHGDEVEVVHILKLLDEVGAERIGREVKREKPIKVASYYGCLLTRPRDVAIDTDVEPTIMERVISAIGCEPVYFPYKTECCCSFQVVNERKIILDRTKKIVSSAVKQGAELIVLTCPLCYYNIDAFQQEISRQDPGFRTLPVLYITQLMGFYFGIDPSANNFSLHTIDPRPVLEKKGML